jgi:hypothetical protein
MQLPDNVWIEVWNQARPVPVRRQKRLFDEGKEAEKVSLNSFFFLLLNKFIFIDSSKFIIIITG